MAAKLVVNFHTMELEFREKSLFARISNSTGRVIQGAELAAGLLPDSKPEVCHGDDFECVTFSWSKLGKLIVKHVDHGRGQLQYDFIWTHRKSSGVLKDVFTMEGAHWYGAGQVKHQHWPIEKWSRDESAYVAGDSYAGQYGGVLERYWLSSNGVAIFVDPDIPLFVGMNHNHDGLLSLSAKWSSPYKNIKDEKVKMTYRVYVAANVKDVHDMASAACIPKPTGIPDEKIFRHPIWSTWARYKKDINQQIVTDFATEIKKHGFNAAQVEIDDDWTPRYGDHDFDENKFPNPKKMIDDIRDIGFRTTVWVHPFCSPMSQSSGGDYWIKSGFLPGHTTWWNGIGKLLDVTRPEAVAWFRQSMKQLQDKYGVASFKFDAGETNWIPNFPSVKNPWSNPNDYTNLWVKLCYECDMDLRAQEVRVGSRTQDVPIFVRMMDKDSKWGFDNGLKSLIPHALTFGIIGYPFVLPDMIGGNAYGSMGIGSSADLPEKELFIRWLQANTFLPSLQFSLCPWQYQDEDILNISKDMVALHAKYSNYFIKVANESVKTGAPIIRPLWWLAPNNEKAQASDDQFMVGDDIVVAPVLIRGATSRNVFLPPGEWTDALRGKVLQGNKLYNNYAANLKELPYFTRVGVDFDFYVESEATPPTATNKPPTVAPTPKADPNTDVAAATAGAAEGATDTADGTAKAGESSGANAAATSASSEPAKPAGPVTPAADIPAPAPANPTPTPAPAPAEPTPAPATPAPTPAPEPANPTPAPQATPAATADPNKEPSDSQKYVESLVEQYKTAKPTPAPRSVPDGPVTIAPHPNQQQAQSPQAEGSNPAPSAAQQQQGAEGSASTTQEDSKAKLIGDLLGKI